MRFFVTIIFVLSCNLSFALNIRDVDLMNNNPIGALIADSVLVFIMIVSCLFFISRFIHVAFRKKYTFEKETALAQNKDYLKIWYKYKRISDNSYVISTMAEIDAFENMSKMEENELIRIVQSGSKYIKCGLNPFSNYQKIRLIEDNKTYYMYCI